MKQEFRGRIFNLRLFVEGISRLRVITLAVAILSVAASALVPIVAWIERSSVTGHEIGPYDMDIHIEPTAICIPAACCVILAPFFFLVLFSFLQKRKDSDFFHAIPYTRTCVYVSFVSAALLSIFAIQIVSALVAGILWSFVPGCIFSVSTYVGHVLSYLLAAAMLAAFMMLALSISGTPGSCMLLFLLFASLIRIVLAIFIGGLSDIHFIDDNYLMEHSVLSPYYFYPLAVIMNMFVPGDANFIVFSLPSILYSLVVTIGLYILAGILYVHRRSEMAGNPAPGVRTQALFRVLFTLPLAFVFTVLLVTDSGTDASVYLVLLVGTLLCYFLYELITTKRAKNMLRAVPALGFVLAACILFGTVSGVTNAYIRNESIDASDIRAVTLDTNRILERYDMDATVTTDSEEIISLIATAYEMTRTDSFYKMDTYSMPATVHLKSGRTMHYRLRISQAGYSRLQELLAKESAVWEMYATIPDASKIYSYCLRVNTEGSEGIYFSSTRGLDKLMRTFRAEFEALSSEQKRQIVLPQAFSKDDIPCMQLTLENRNGNYASRHYYLTTDLPETRRMAVSLWGRTNSHFEMAGTGYSGTPQEMISHMQEHLREIGKDPEKHMSYAGTFSLLDVDSDASARADVKLTPAALEEVLTLLDSVLLPEKSNGTPEVEPLYCIQFSVEQIDGTTVSLMLDLNALASMDDDTLRTLEELFDTKLDGRSEIFSD